MSQKDATSSSGTTNNNLDLPLQISISRNLSDKLYEKRKLGALEVEQLVKDLNNNKDYDRINHVIQHLVTNFSDSTQGNYRKGGLIALAATAIGLGIDTKKYIPQLVPPVLKCFGDPDSRIRYYACESLYNIAKVARFNILIYFNEIFDALCKLSADPEINVKNAAQLLDRLIKDIVTEFPIFDINKFIPLLQERIYVVNPNCRQFLIAWLVVLDSVPDIHLLFYLPKFLDGLFNMLKDTSKDIRLEAHACLSEFLREIINTTNNNINNNNNNDNNNNINNDQDSTVTTNQETVTTNGNDTTIVNDEIPITTTTTTITTIDNKTEDNNNTSNNDSTTTTTTTTTPNNNKEQKVEFGSIVKILLVHCNSKDEYTRLTTLEWVYEFLTIGKEELLIFSHQLLSAILPCLSHDVNDIKIAATRANSALLKLITETNAFFSISDFLNTVTIQFLNQNVPTRLAALEWVLVLHSKRPSELSNYVNELFPALLKTLSDPSEEVIRLDLEVMAKISHQDQSYFTKLLVNLVHLFSTDRQLLENRGSLIIRQLSILMNPEKIFVTLSKVMETIEDYEFATIMIQTLNLILLTSSELSDVRLSLKNLLTNSTTGSKELFATLYRSWSHNPAATFSLCLLSQLYEHATDLIFKLYVFFFIYFLFFIYLFFIVVN